MAKEETPEERSARIAAMRAELAEEDARIEAEQQAKRAAADQVVRDLVLSPEFKALRPMVEATNAAAPRSVEVQHIAEMMDRLAAANPA